MTVLFSVKREMVPPQYPPLSTPPIPASFHSSLYQPLFTPPYTRLFSPLPLLIPASFHPSPLPIPASFHYSQFIRSNAATARPVILVRPAGI